MSDKPTKPKPQFFAQCFGALQVIAKDLGYNLVLHGSINRDMDLVAIPWVAKPASHYELLCAFCSHLGVLPYRTAEEFGFSMLPGGRYSYIINLNRGGQWNGYFDEQYYLDISITPLGASQ